MNERRPTVMRISTSENAAVAADARTLGVAGDA
jgi:hypothetical protein